MLEWITSTINSLGYWGIAFLMLLENIFPPIPSEVIMPLAGFTTTQGELNMGLTIGAGVLGSIVGALPWYYLGRKVGERRLHQWVEQHGKWLTLSGEDIDRSKQWFDQYGSGIVLFGRLIPGIRTFISVPAGLEEMPLFEFLVYSTIGTAIWVSLLTYAGYVLGQNYEQVEKVLGPISIGVLVAFAIGLGVTYFKRRKRQAK